MRRDRHRQDRGVPGAHPAALPQRAAAATAASDKYDGQITSRINGQKQLVDSISSQVSDWDRRLEARRSNLERTYAALEVQLSGLKSQSSWLTSQLGSLPQGSRNS